MDAKDRQGQDHDPVVFRQTGTNRSWRRWQRSLVVVVVVVFAVVMLFAWVFPWIVAMQQDPLLGTQALRAFR